MNELELKSGIYKITVNDYYIYIGQSNRLRYRWNEHLNKLKQNKHCNKKFQNVFNKYPDNIKFEIIELCDVDMLDEREMYWISYYSSYNTKHGLNLSIGGDCGSRKYKTKEEVKAAALEHFKQYRKTHKEDLKEYYRQRYIDNKKELKVKSKQYYQDNKKYFRQRYQYNKDKIKEHFRQYYQDNKKEFKVKSKEYRRNRGILSQSERRKLKFEIRYKLSRPLTNEEWNIWRTNKSISGCQSKPYAIKFLKTLSDLTFVIK